MKGYVFNEKVTKINQTKNAIREIYNSRTKSIIYLSIDFEKGAFEVCNYRGCHLGEFSYEGEKIGNAKPDHDIKLKK
jgi:uncharacterized membrane protein YfhO